MGIKALAVAYLEYLYKDKILLTRASLFIEVLLGIIVSRFFSCHPTDMKECWISTEEPLEFHESSMRLIKPHNSPGTNDK